MEEYLLDLPFKGHRDYLHSTDIYPALIKLAGEKIGAGAWVKSLSLRRPFRHCIMASFDKSISASGTFRIQSKSEIFTGSLCETGIPVARRISHDSSRISDFAVMGPNSVEIVSNSLELSCLEVFVSLMKLMANQVNPGQWWLCQMDLDAPLSNEYPLKVQLLRSIEKKFLVFEWSQSNRVIGSARILFDSGRLEAQHK